MSRSVRGLLATIAVLAGVSPLLWVTANEYLVLARAEEIRSDREVLLERARTLVAGGSIDKLGALVRDTRQRHPDDDALARELAMILLQGSHSAQFGQPGSGKEIPGDSP